ncbi:MAG: lipoyl synthase [Bacteroidales bacterium]|nr:lipoyl synthase [Bacteroidales bacterium]
MSDHLPYLPKPSWLKVKLPRAEEYQKVKKTMQHELHTICESGMCPNLAECWSMKTATFMILGNICTRNCSFCAVKHGKPNAINPYEPAILSAAVGELGLRHLVITSVTRDDLPDHGAGHWAECIRRIHRDHPNVTIEVLVPDFHARKDLIELITREKPDIYGHNLETVSRLTPIIRSIARFEVSLDNLRMAKSLGMTTKSGIMIGLGESIDEIKETLSDLRHVGCDIVTIGQYLQPTRHHYPVQRYYTPEEFEILHDFALNLGFKHVESGPLVRSSYHSKPIT